MTNTMINKEMRIEYLLENYPGMVRYLMRKGIKCIICGEPVWGTLEEEAKEKGYNDEQLDELVNEMNKFFGEN